MEKLFPSPYGDLLFLIRFEIEGMDELIGFPSPCGD